MTTPRSQGDTSPVLLIIGVIAGLLLPLVGLIIAIILFATGRAQQAVWVLVASIIGWVAAFVIYLG